VINPVSYLVCLMDLDWAVRKRSWPVPGGSGRMGDARVDSVEPYTIWSNRGLLPKDSGN
jgi:hypothetical protein